MRKKIIPISFIIVLFVMLSIIPQATADSSLLETSSTFRIFSFETDTKIELDEETVPNSPIKLNELQEIEFTVSFKYDLPAFFPKILLGTKIGNWIIFRDTEHSNTIEVNLSVEAPEWCDAQLIEETVYIEDIGTDFKGIKSKLAIILAEDAPALEKGDVKIFAKFNTNDSWGLAFSENSTTFTVIPEYVGNLTAVIEQLQDVDEYFVKHNANNTLQMTITNNYNGESKVKLECDNDDSEIKWNITVIPEEITIPKYSNKTVEIIIKTSSSPKKQSIQRTFKLTPQSTMEIDLSEEYLTGESIEISTGLITKKSVDEPLEIDANLMLIMILGVIIIISMILIIKKIKK